MMKKSGPIGVNTCLNLSINRSTIQHMGIMTLTVLLGLYGFVGMHDEQAGLILTCTGYIAGIIGMKTWNRYRSPV